MAGDILFEDRSLDDFFSDHLADVLANLDSEIDGRPTPARVRRVAEATAWFVDVPALHTPSNVTIAEHEDKVVARCNVSFDGNAALFHCFAPQWPESRALFGSVEGQTLTLSAISAVDLAEWLPTLLASEVQGVERYLAGQVRAVDEFNAGLGKWAREVAENYSYPRPIRGGKSALDVYSLPVLHFDLSLNLNQPLLPSDLRKTHLKGGQESDD